MRQVGYSQELSGIQCNEIRRLHKAYICLCKLAPSCIELIHYSQLQIVNVLPFKFRSLEHNRTQTVNLFNYMV